MDITGLIGTAQNAYSMGLQTRVAKDASSVGGVDQSKARAAAESFESFFVGQMLEYMWQGVEVDPMFGGGHAEEMWRSMLNQEYGKHIVKSGGLGIANQVMAEMLKSQEARTAAVQDLSGAMPTASAEPADGAQAAAGSVAVPAAMRR